MIKLILLSILPISELRGAILYSKIVGMNQLASFFVATTANILIIPILFMLLEHLHGHLRNYRTYRTLFYYQTKKVKRKIEKHIGTKWEYPALFFLVAIPMPFTGAYTGVFAAWLFRLNRKKSLYAIVLGVLTAGILVSSGLSIF
ncbi:small multi-drug export protein [archaeon]|nr:small multi-drug export protein [archaeon]